jgi:hypothetical protein
MPAPFLSSWFAILDSDTPDRILDLLADDFRFAIVFSEGEGDAQDFCGGRPEMEGYLAQRERGALAHSEIASSTVESDELYLGQVRRAGGFEASFVAAARLTEDGHIRRLLISRSPSVDFGNR